LLFTDSDNNWTAAEFANSNMDNVALDVHWALEKSYDYFKNVHSRNSYDGNNSPIQAYVHPNMPGFGVANSNDNAVWLFTPHIMLFGDGVQYNPWTSLDIVGHEYGHGITQFLVSPNSGSGMLSSSGQSGAIVEGLSDVWGALIENYASVGKSTWRFGEDIMKNGKPCIRSMQNPKSDSDPGQSNTGGFPDTYLGQYWDNNGEVHTNSTIFSHWFYLVASGGVGKNDLQNNYSVNGVGLSSAAKIVYRLVQSYFQFHLTPTFADARIYSEAAAVDLFCFGSPEHLAVANAWYAVGVGATPNIAAIAMVGAPPICGSLQFSVANPPASSTLIWATDYPTALAINTSSGLTTRQNGFNGSVNVTVSINSVNGCSTQLVRNIWVGLPGFPGPISGNTTPVSGGVEFYTSAYPGAGASSHSWLLPAGQGSPWILNSFTTNYANATVGDDIGFVQCVASNTCGSSPAKLKIFPQQPGGGGGGGCTICPRIMNEAVEVSDSLFRKLTLYPIPANKQFTIRLNSPLSSNEIFSIFDSFGALVMNVRVLSGSQFVEIDTESIQHGVYLVRIVQDKKITYKKILIEH
jgi:hypothetical protein